MSQIVAADRILISENAAAKHIEQHIRIVMRTDRFFRSGLEAVAAGHYSCEIVRTTLD